MTLTLLFYLLVVHWIADFCLQLREWAINKSSNNIALTKHVTTYTVCLWVAAIWLNAFHEYPLSLSVVGLSAHWALLNGVAHWVTDFCTSRLTTHFYNKGRMHEFFCVIGLDQVLHYVVLFWTATLFLKGF